MDLGGLRRGVQDVYGPRLFTASYLIAKGIHLGIVADFNFYDLVGGVPKSAKPVQMVVSAPEG